MKKIIYSFLVASLILALASCEKNENKIFGGEFLQFSGPTQDFPYDKINDGSGIPSEFIVNYAGPAKSSPIDYSFSIDPESKAIENLHYTIDSATGTIPADEFSAQLPITILDDNINPGEILTLIITITSDDVDVLPSAATSTFNISVLCDSDLNTTYSYVNTDLWREGPFSGTGELSGADGQYDFSDFSFGAWAGVYNIDPPSGSLKFVENCGIIGYTGLDNFNGTWTIEEVISSGGPEFSFKWSNTYGEFGTVTLTKEDGTDWPLLQN